MAICSSYDVAHFRYAFTRMSKGHYGGYWPNENKGYSQKLHIGRGIYGGACNNWLRAGACKFGNTCKFGHVGQNLRTGEAEFENAEFLLKM